MEHDPFWLWCHYHGPVGERFDQTTQFDEFRMNLGNEWESRYIAQQFPNVYRVQAKWTDGALRETLEAMLRGERAIEGAALWLLSEDVYGKADLLVRSDDAPSDLGDFHYRVKEIKNAAKLKPYHQLQAAAYVWILGTIQGYTAETFDIVLRDGAGECCVTYQDVAPRMRSLMAEWQLIRDGHQPPGPLAYDSTFSPWRRYSNGLLRQRGCVSLLPGVGPKTAARLRERGYGTISEILALGPAGCDSEFGCTDWYYHALAYREGRPVFRPGEAASITRRQRLVYFDVEDTSVLDGQIVFRPHTYMLGAATGSFTEDKVYVVQTGTKTVERWPGQMVCAAATYQEGETERRAAIFVGPEFGTVQRQDLVQAAREAGDADFDVLVACAFNYEAHATEFNKLGRIPVLKARMNADLHMAEDLKNTGKGNLFVIFGEPDIVILPESDGQIRVKVNGVDVFHPNTGEVRSDGADGIACWFIDTDYNDESFFVRHAYFLGASDPYKSLKTTLKAEINEEAWESLHSDASRPFDKPKSGRIAVKVINHLGDEVMKVFRI